MPCNLLLRSHVLSISRRVHFSLLRLKYHRNALSRELRSTLVTSLIFPILDYCCLVYNDLTDEPNTKLQRLIGCGIRFIFDLKRDVYISPFSRSLGWLTVKSRRLYLLGIATFSILQDCPPPPHLISVIFSFALLPQFVLHAGSPPMYLRSLISVRLPSIIHFTCLPLIFGTLSLIPYAPRPPSGYSRVVFSSTYLTSITTLIHAPESLWSQCWSGSPWALSRLAFDPLLLLRVA